MASELVHSRSSDPLSGRYSGHYWRQLGLGVDVVGEHRGDDVGDALGVVTLGDINRDNAPVDVHVVDATALEQPGSENVGGVGVAAHVIEAVEGPMAHAA